MRNRNVSSHAFPSEAFFCLSFGLRIGPLQGCWGGTTVPFKIASVAPDPGFSWTGVYLGIGGGTGWGNNAYTWNQDATLAAVAAQMPNPGTLPQLSPTQGSLPISGGYFGGQIGGNWQVERAVKGKSRPTLTGLISRDTVVASMRVQ